ncbi:hypothetical protein DY052_07650 [Apilactobacillus timberlakei]|uniref:hypothetical protein n=1 Tax=Apilactobacillus timberlakei TaxID=2008380 RepID=UPI001127F083|nr:hypothetical protein [Apilactobacillus timberlakei]TPR13728.1 hypothetical protein DY052_07650 [Apilactobacillus timberlakei]
MNNLFFLATDINDTLQNSTHAVNPFSKASAYVATFIVNFRLLGYGLMLALFIVGIVLWRGAAGRDYQPAGKKMTIGAIIGAILLMFAPGIIAYFLSRNASSSKSTFSAIMPILKLHGMFLNNLAHIWLKI